MDGGGNTGGSSSEISEDEIVSINDFKVGNSGGGIAPSVCGVKGEVGAMV